MAKIRGVKPEYWTDDDVMELSIAARLLFIGLWNYACDNGHLQDRPKQIKMRILPGDDVDVAELLEEIAVLGLIERSDGVIHIPNLARHQKPHKRWWKTCDLADCTVPDGASSTPHNRGATVAQQEANGGATGGHGCATADVDVDVDVDVDGDTSSKIADAISDQEIRDDVERLCVKLADSVEARGVKRPTITKAWRDAARLMLDRDGHTEDQITWLIDWTANDEFWRSNILAMPKLRAQFDQLKLRAVPPSIAPVRQYVTELPPDGLSEAEMGAWWDEQRARRGA